MSRRVLADSWHPSDEYLLSAHTDALAKALPRRCLPWVTGDREPTETDAIREARRWLADGLDLLVLSGRPGLGKTLAACVVAGEYRWAAAKRGDCAAVMLVDVARLARLSRYEASDFEPLERADMLVVDDLGMEFADKRGSFATTIDGLVNARYADARRTIITTNLPAAEFRRRYGERVADRIREAGRFVELRGESLRGRK